MQGLLGASDYVDLSLLERVLYILVLSQHIQVLFVPTQPHAMGLNSSHPLGISITAKCASFLEHGTVLFTLPSHACSSFMAILSNSSVRNLGGHVILISQMKTQKEQSHTLSL